MPDPVLSHGDYKAEQNKVNPSDILILKPYVLGRSIFCVLNTHLTCMLAPLAHTILLFLFFFIVLFNKYLFVTGTSYWMLVL